MARLRASDLVIVGKQTWMICNGLFKRKFSLVHARGVMRVTGGSVADLRTVAANETILALGSIQADL